MLHSIRGTRLNVIDAGSGPPILFVHSLGGDATNWRPQLTRFRTTNRVIALDLRGFGRSDRTYGEMTLEDYAEDVVAVLDCLEIEQCVYVGLSIGGMIGQAVALRAGSRLAGLVLCDTSSHATEPLQQAVLAAGDAVAMGGMSAVADVFATVAFAPETIARQPPGYLEFLEQFGSSDPLVVRIGIQAIAALDFTDRLKAVDVPTLIVCGALDMLIPLEHSELLHQAIPGSRLEQMADTGHMSNIEQPDTFNHLLEGFLKTIAWL